MIWDKWIDKWEKTLNVIEKIGGEKTDIKVLKPAKIEEIEKVESQIGTSLPESFREVLLNFSSGVDFSWYLNDALELPEELEEIFSGECFWSLDNLVSIEKDRKTWIKECFSDPENEYDQVWYNKLGFMSVKNGDMIAFDLEKYPEYTPVVYLSHDGGDGHGCILGEDFQDFISKWTEIGCPGSEDWQMIPFMTSPFSGIDPDSGNAVMWKKIINL